MRSGVRIKRNEINEIVVGLLSQLLFTAELFSVGSLFLEGIGKSKIILEVYAIVDSLGRYKPRAVQSDRWEFLGIKRKGYIIITNHQSSNIDDSDRLMVILYTLQNIQTIGLYNAFIFPIRLSTLI